MEAAYQKGQTAVFACGRNTSWRYHHIVRWPSISRGDGKGNIETGRTLTWKKIQLRRRGQSREHCVHKKESINILHNYILLTTVRTYTVTHNSVLMFCLLHSSLLTSHVPPSQLTIQHTCVQCTYLYPQDLGQVQRHSDTWSHSQLLSDAMRGGQYSYIDISLLPIMRTFLLACTVLQW